MTTTSRLTGLWLASLLVALAAPTWPALASHSQTTPPARMSPSWYMTSVDTLVAYERGRSDGASVAGNCDHWLTFLDFGQIDYSPGLDSYMVWTFNASDSWHSLFEVYDATINYATGWYNTAPACASLEIAVSTHNNRMCPSGPPCDRYWAGRNWAKYTADVQSWLVNTGRSHRVNARAGIDIETNEPQAGWECASATRQFVDGYNSNNALALRFENFGDANGVGLPAGSCWTTADIHYVSWGAAANYPYPQMYNQYRADSWTDVRAYSSMTFTGVMSECNVLPFPSQNCTVNDAGQIRTEWVATPQAWQNFMNTLSVRGFGQPTLNFATNIRYQ